MTLLKYNKQSILEEIFKSKFLGDASKQIEIPIYFEDIRDAGEKLGMELPVSYSNFVLDLCRKNRGIQKRVPKVVVDCGYDLKKATGSEPNSLRKLVGKFMYVGVGNEIQSWISWPEPRLIIEVDSSGLHPTVRKLLRKDEAAMFSMIDFLDLLTIATENAHGSVHRLQSPMKWQPNEIDGMYFSEDESGLIFFPVEAKALTTKDEINVDQLAGGFRTVKSQVQKIGLSEEFQIQSVAALMTVNGIRFAFFPTNIEPDAFVDFDFIEVKFDPPLDAWITNKKPSSE